VKNTGMMPKLARDTMGNQQTKGGSIKSLLSRWGVGNDSLAGKSEKNLRVQPSVASEGGMNIQDETGIKWAARESLTRFQNKKRAGNNLKNH